MVWKWIKENIIGDYAEERRRYKAEQAAKTEAWRVLKTRVFSTRDFSVEIVGESHYQDALRHSKDDVKDFGGTDYITTVVAREPDNPYDSGAVKVMNGRLETIGYLARKLAAKYGPAIELWEAEGYNIRCQAKLSGGEGRRLHFGAWLDLDAPEAIEAKFHDPNSRK